MTRERRCRGPRGAACAGLAVALLAWFAWAPANVRAQPPERVSISRDAYGEPHVRGRSVRGAMFGFAWAQMEDQAAYLLTNIETSNGRSAAVLGPGCLPDCFESDQATHLFRVPETARERYDSLPVGSRVRYQGFADGINAYVESHPERVPGWAHRVTPEDVLASVEWPFVLGQARQAAARAGGAGVARPALERAAGAGGASFADALAEVESPTVGAASNMFALGASKTATGAPILEGNPHLQFEGPSQWYVAKLEYPGTRVQGATFRGGLGIALGANEHVAWSHTANGSNAHEEDAYVEALDPADPDRYRFGSELRAMERDQAVVGVQVSPGVVQPVTVRFRYTVHGPVISDPLAAPDGSQPPPSGSVAVSATVSQFEQYRLGTQLFRENDADSIAELRAAGAELQLSGFHTIAADDQGSVFYVAGSRSGIVNPGFDHTRALDGSNPATAWQGIVPYAALPQALDPPSGYFQNANNGAQFSAPGQIDPAAIPFYLQGGGNGQRSRRQIDLLGPLNAATLADAERIGNDSFVEPGPSLRALLDQAAAEPGADPRLVAAAALIAGWDGRASADSDEFPLFATWTRGLRESALGFAVAAPPELPHTFSAAQRAEAERAMIVAHDGMLAAHGMIAVPYGNLHTLTWGAFEAPVNGAPNDLATLKLTGCKRQPGSLSPVAFQPCAVENGSGFMFNADLASGRFTVQRPISDSDDPASPQYTANARDYVADRYREFPVTRAALRAERTSKRSLKVSPDAAVALRSRRARLTPRGRLLVSIRCRVGAARRCRGRLRLGRTRDGYSVRPGRRVVALDLGNREPGSEHPTSASGSRSGERRAGPKRGPLLARADPGEPREGTRDGGAHRPLRLTLVVGLKRNPLLAGRAAAGKPAVGEICVDGAVDAGRVVGVGGMRVAPHRQQARVAELAHLRPRVHVGGIGVVGSADDEGGPR